MAVSLQFDFKITYLQIEFYIAVFRFNMILKIQYDFLVLLKLYYNAIGEVCLPHILTSIVSVLRAAYSRGLILKLQ